MPIEPSPSYEHAIEQRQAVKYLARLLKELRAIDEAIQLARQHLVVLQPTREGRIDVRMFTSRYLDGAKEPRFVKWLGRGERRRLHARLVTSRAAIRGVRLGRGEARAKYSAARLLVSRIAATMATRNELIAVLRTFERRLNQADRANATAKLVVAVSDVSALAERTLAEYQATKANN